MKKYRDKENSGHEIFFIYELKVTKCECFILLNKIFFLSTKPYRANIFNIKHINFTVKQIFFQIHRVARLLDCLEIFKDNFLGRITKKFESPSTAPLKHLLEKD